MIDVAADRPVVLAVLRVVEVRAAEVGAHHHHHPVRHAVLLRVVPQIVHAVREVAQQPLMVRVVVSRACRSRPATGRRSRRRPS